MKIRIQREPRFGYSARGMQISINGAVVGELQNGEERTFDVPAGNHSLSFQIGKKTRGFVSVAAADNDEEVFITCWCEADGRIEILSAHSGVQRQTSNNSNGHSGTTGGVIALCVVAAIIFFFLFFRIEIGFFFVPMP